eukprot:GDKK01067339.1.p1 GENE.GDKK01067339.1~~GDKK01067339.1.p1  ORF type:complete len:142 (-),score=8.61 GDKK01067339.1:244-669(-)
MVRYTQRAWYHPIGFMSQSLLSYPIMVMTIAGLVTYPNRYQIADYWERCSQDPGDVLKAKAILYYSELEIVGKRQAYIFGPQRNDYGLPNNGDLRMVAGEIKKGSPSIDEEYFRVHYIDALRVKSMQDEIGELKKAMAKSS